MTEIEAKIPSEPSSEYFHSRNQYLATITANGVALSYGFVGIAGDKYKDLKLKGITYLSFRFILGWTSPALPILASLNSPLATGPLTNDQISWIGSINFFGGALCSLSIGFLASLIGSKKSVFLMAVPVMIFWLLIYFGNEYYQILIARFVVGMTGAGMQSVIMLFVSEIANDNIRGRLGSIMVVTRNVGTLFGYIIGTSFDYKVVPMISMIVPIIFIIIFPMIPNSPQYFLRKGQIQKAENALKFYKGYKGKSIQGDETFHKEFERLKAISTEQKKGEDIRLADFFSRSALKGIGIGIALTALTQFTACFTLISYAVMTFQKVGTAIDPYISSMGLGVTNILGCLVTTYLADFLGRRKLNLISMMGSACGLLGTALYHYLGLIGYDLSAFAWIPVACLSFVIFISSAGIVPLALICSIEFLPSKIRTYGVTIIVAILALIVFISMKTYPALLNSIDVHGCLFCYGIASIIGFFFVLFVQKETSGKSLDDTDEVEESKTNGHVQA